VGGLAVLAVLVGTWYAEGSAEEGLLRASFEAAAFGTAFLALGRVLGLRAGADAASAGAGSPSAGEQLRRGG
jgi:hypothetical protein